LVVVVVVDIAEMELVDIAALVPNQAAAGTVVAVDRTCSARVAMVRSVVAVDTVVADMVALAGH
jgi:hypothetical protein